MPRARVCAGKRLSLGIDDRQIGGLDELVDDRGWGFVRGDMTTNGCERNIENGKARYSQCRRRDPTKQAPSKLMERIVDLLFEAPCFDLQLGRPAIGQEIFPAVQKHDACGGEVGPSGPG